MSYTESNKEEVTKIIKALGLKNAIAFKGKVNPKAILGKVLSEKQELRTEINILMPIINSIADEINSMNTEEQKTAFEEFKDSNLNKEKEKKKNDELKELPNAIDGKVVMRMAPSPSGPMHIGHAYVMSLNYEYVKKYNGKLVLRLEDTNPENIYIPAYDMIPEDAQWMCDNNIADVVIQSDRLEIYYKYAEELLTKGDLYVCNCKPEDYKELITKSEACPCRNLSPEEQLKRWNLMKDKDNGYKQGEVVVRFKSDINHKNPAMRDFPLLRINDSTHPRVGNKYRVWPLMNWSVSIDDMELGITHTLRGKDHADNAKRQAMIHEKLGYPTPEAISVGMINFIGFELSTSKTREKIEDGLYTGFDDIRIPFIRAMKKRGYTPLAFRNYAKQIGISRNDKSVEIHDYFKTLESLNKEVIDKDTDRYFFVADPEKITINKAPTKEITLDLHTEFRKGGRTFKVNEEFYISKEDRDKIKSEETIRLMDCLNFMKKGDLENGIFYEYESSDYESFKNTGKQIIHYLPADHEQIVPVEIVMPDGFSKKGLAEKGIENIEIDQTVQFERVGFCKLNEIKTNLETGKKSYLFWFAHQ